MDPTTVGLRSNSIVLGKHSGRHALGQALQEMGFELDGHALNTAFKRFKEIADRKKQVTAMDLEALVTDELREAIAGYALEWFEVDASSLRPPHAKVSITLPDGTSSPGAFTGDGPIDAVFQAINVASGIAAKLSDFTIAAVTEGQDALGEVSVVLEVDGSTGAGQGVSTDIIDAAARAYVRALSVAVARSQAPEAMGLPEAAAG
jgi:2-isopropylmalate synthase